MYQSGGEEDILLSGKEERRTYAGAKTLYYAKNLREELICRVAEAFEDLHEFEVTHDIYESIEQLCQQCGYCYYNCPVTSFDLEKS